MSSTRRSGRAAIIALAVGLAITCDAARAATVNAQLREPGVVWRSDGQAAAPQQLTMRNVAKSFAPELLFVPVGSTIQFPNDDPFYHSIYSLSSADPFDIGFYDTGPGKIVTFAMPGGLAVTCHIHAHMHATIIVVDGPVQQSLGSVRFDGVPQGSFVLHAWSLALGERTTTVRVPAQSANVTLRDPL